MSLVMTVAPEELTKITRSLPSDLRVTDSTNGKQFRGDGVVISVYSTGKIVFQGKNAQEWYSRLSATCSPETGDDDLSAYASEYPRIGTDESGKGDFFGPLVIAGFCVRNRETAAALEELGVRDSKKIADSRIPSLAREIRDWGEHEVITIMPEKYNQLYDKMKNLNQILAWAHSRALENLMLRVHCDLAIADQFGDRQYIERSLFSRGRKATLVQTPRAERDIAVAAASILAREEFLLRLGQLSVRHSADLPKGAGDKVLEVGMRLVKDRGPESLLFVSKTHFRTYNEIVNSLNRT